MHIRDADGLWRLAAALVKQAKRDLRRGSPYDRAASEAFFRGPMFRAICDVAGRDVAEARTELGV